jgi:transposase-like protein
MIGLKYVKHEPETLAICIKRQYAPEYRIKLASEAIECGNVSAVARKYDVARQTIDNWVKKANTL